MAAIKDWSDGELLTPATMNEVSSNMYLRFANDAARDAFLVGDYAPYSGMMVSMLDTNLTLQYVVVSGTGYWAPLPGLLCFYANQSAAQPLPTTFTAITGYTLANHGNRNYGSWFNTSTGKFNPKIPGLYEFAGGMSTASATGYHRAGFRLNGTGAVTFDTASEGRGYTFNAVPVSWSLRRWLCSMNGTTDYVEMVAALATAGSTSTAEMAPTFSAKYYGQ